MATGPMTWENWTRWTESQQVVSRFEAELWGGVGANREWISVNSPYQVLNAFHKSSPDGVTAPRVVVRAETVKITESNPSTKDVARFHGGTFDDELAALISLALGARFQSVGITRQWGLDGDPLGRPASLGVGSVHLPTRSARGPVVPRLDKPADLSDVGPYFESYRNAGAVRASWIVRASRLYQQAVWVADSDPNQCWVMLVSAIEAAAQTDDAGARSADDDIELLPPSIAKVIRELPNLSADDHSRFVDALRPITGSTKKFLSFFDRYSPPPPQHRIDGLTGAVDWVNLRKALRAVYDYRSTFLHDGTPFPWPMCTPPMTFDDHLGGRFTVEQPIGEGSAARGGSWLPADLPMHLWVFEHAVRSALHAWWLEGSEGSA